LSVAAAQENATISYSVNISVTSGVVEGAVVSMVSLGALELDAALERALDFELGDELLDEDSDAWLEAMELIATIELTAELELLSSLLLLAILSADDVCGLVLVLLFAVKPLSLVPALPPPPPHALKSEISVAAKRVVIVGKLKLLIGYYLLHATAIDEMGLRQLDP
jgi:hypothetical protein